MILYNDDCLKILPTIESKSIDMICSDLPYEVTQNKSDIKIPFEPLWKEYERIIKDNGCIALFGQGIFYVDLVNSNRKLFRYDLIWKIPKRLFRIQQHIANRICNKNRNNTKAYE